MASNCTHFLPYSSGGQKSDMGLRGLKSRSQLDCPSWSFWGRTHSSKVTCIARVMEAPTAPPTPPACLLPVLDWILPGTRPLVGLYEAMSPPRSPLSPPAQLTNSQGTTGYSLCLPPGPSRSPFLRCPYCCHLSRWHIVNPVLASPHLAALGEGGC